MAERKRYTFQRSQRLTGRSAFGDVFDLGKSRRAGPLTVRMLPNDLEHCRLGIVMPKRVGSAPVRNRIKRLIRESFRLSQHDWPRGYDVVVQVFPHQPVTLAEYQRLLFGAMRHLRNAWQKQDKAANQSESDAAGQE